MKILMMPLFQFPTGHTKTAEAMEENVREEYPDVVIETVDFLTYCKPILEKFSGSFYLKWIRIAPSLYQSTYRILMSDPLSKMPKVKSPLWSQYFEKKMKQLLAEEAPDLIICTHSFPSKIIGKLIEKQAIAEIPVINVYTDLFMNGIWAKRGVKYHFVPNEEARNLLILKHQVPRENIFVTGIPISPAFTQMKRTSFSENGHVLVAGGNTGLINVEALTTLMLNLPTLRFTILCGNNEGLYHSLVKYESELIKIRKYIDSPEEMNCLYDKVDAIITKPGGVTLGEVIHKRLPIFVSHCLPGQEEVNLEYLLQHGMARKISLTCFDQKEAEWLCHTAELEQMVKNMDTFSSKINVTVREALTTVITAEVTLKLKEQISLNTPTSSYEKAYEKMSLPI